MALLMKRNVRCDAVSGELCDAVSDVRYVLGNVAEMKM